MKIPAKLLTQFYLLDARLAVLDRTEMADTNRTHSKLVTCSNTFKKEQEMLGLWLTSKVNRKHGRVHNFFF